MTIQSKLNAMHQTELVAALQQARLMPVLRTDTPEQALWACETLYDEGFRVFDITLNTGGSLQSACHVIEALTEKYEDMIIGAGTVLTPADAMAALGAGAKFLLSPGLDLDMLQFCTEHWVPILPGVTTPTEMLTAIRAGAQILKFFPAEPVGGAAYLKAVKAPLPEVHIVPTGGIDEEHVTGYLQAGALAVGIGGSLLSSSLLATQDTQKLRRHAQLFKHRREVFLDLHAS